LGGHIRCAIEQYGYDEGIGGDMFCRGGDEEIAGVRSGRGGG
jgi:hypothetical protein